MTETELTDRLREAIVLDGPDVWRTNGYLQDAQQAGLSLTDALKRATEIGQEVSNNSILFGNIRARIARLAQPSRSHLIEQDIAQIINAATSLKLSPDFVKNRWIPTELHRLTAASVPPKPEPIAPVAPSPEPVAEKKTDDQFSDLLETKPEPPKPVLPKIEPPVTVDLPVREPAKTAPVSPPPVVEKQPIVPPSPPSRPEPAPVVRSFTATPARVRKGEPVTLAWEVDNLLAVTIDDLGEGLSPTNRGWVKPSKTADYTLFDANDNPLSTVRVEVIQPDRSGVYGVLFALALLAIIYWFIRSSNARESEPAPSRKTEQTTKRRTASVSRQKRKTPVKATTTEATDTPVNIRTEPTPAPSDNSGNTNKPVVGQQPVNESVTQAESKSRPNTPADARQGKYEEAFGSKPYDKIELGTDERGWRRARTKGRWGYVNEADEWVIQPEYEAVTPFRGNTAAVFLNGQLMTINRAGEQVKN